MTWFSDRNAPTARPRWTDSSSLSGEDGDPRWGLLAFLALSQLALSGFNAVDGGVIAALSRDPGTALAVSSQHVLDSPLPIALGHLLGAETLAGAAALAGALALIPILALALGKPLQFLSSAQTYSLLAVSCITPVWKTLALYVGKADGICLALSVTLVLAASPAVLLLSAILLVLNHIQQGILILSLLALVCLPDRRRAFLLTGGGVAGYVAAVTLQSILGMQEHAGRTDYVLAHWGDEVFNLTPVLILAIAGALGGGWIVLFHGLRNAPVLRLRAVCATGVAIAVGIIVVDNSRDMFLFTFPLLLWVMREQLLIGTFRPSPRFLALSTLACGFLPDIQGGLVRLSSWSSFLARASLALRS